MDMLDARHLASPVSPSREPADQADGLRRLFAADRMRFVPVVANPHGGGYGVPLERLATTFAEGGAQVLVVDAAENSPLPQPMAEFDLSACVEPLSARVAYLAASGLPLKHADAQGSCATFLDLLCVAWPRADVTLVHASAQTLVRLFHAQALRPVLMAGTEAESITHAYAALKLLWQRCHWQQFDLFLSAQPYALGTARIAQRLGDCAERFIGVNLYRWAAADVQAAVNEPISTQLQRLAAGHWQARSAAGMPWQPA